MATVLLTFLVVISGIALVPLAILSNIASHRLFSCLRTNHHDLWMTLGEPTIWGGRLTASSAAARYFTTRQYLGSADQELRQKGSRARTLLYAAITDFLVFLLSALALNAIGA